MSQYKNILRFICVDSFSILFCVSLYLSYVYVMFTFLTWVKKKFSFSKGPKGYKGLSGTEGVPAKNGRRGPSGEPGRAGPSGNPDTIKGAKGEPGNPGIDGKKGLDGKYSIIHKL